MARRKRKSVEANDSGSSGRITAEEKISRLLGMLLVKDMKKKTERVPILRAAGFTIKDVAEMLGMTENHVKVADHHGRRARKAS